MPIFEFVCATCGHPFEELVRSAIAVEQVNCPTCGSLQVRKKMSTFASKISGGSLSFGASLSAACNTGST